LSNQLKKKILVVDDMASMRGVICALLKNLGHTNLDQAEDGSQALNKLRSSDYDLVISDWNMPKISGIELLKEIRKDEKLKQIPVLLVTAETKLANIKEAIESGVTDFIVKPFTQQSLDTKLSKVWA